MRGEGDAIATATYARAYGEDEEFFAFYRSLQAYRTSFNGNSDVLVLDPRSEFFEYFGRDSGAGGNCAKAPWVPRAAARAARTTPERRLTGSGTPPRARSSSR